MLVWTDYIPILRSPRTAEPFHFDVTKKGTFTSKNMSQSGYFTTFNPPEFRWPCTYRQCWAYGTGRPISIKQVSCHQWLSVVLLMMGHNRNHFDRWSDERVLRFGFLAVHRWRHWWKDGQTWRLKYWTRCECHVCLLRSILIDISCSGGANGIKMCAVVERLFQDLSKKILPYINILTFTSVIPSVWRHQRPPFRVLSSTQVLN